MESKQYYEQAADIGVGGTSLRALDLRAKSPLPALTSLAEWKSAAASLPAAFPFLPVLRHFQAVGRTRADTELIKALRALAEVVSGEEDAAGSLILSSWLPSTFDQEDGDYDSYAAIPLLNRLADLDTDGPDAMLDVEQVALLADLLQFEATTLAYSADSSEQEMRTRACVRSLLRAVELAPRASAVLSCLPFRGGGSGAGLLAGRALALAHQALDAVSPVVREVVEIAMLPTTTLHDEVMFIRSIQVFELVYRQVAQCLDRAVAALSAGDAPRATAEVKDAAARIVATGMLYRILTTMPRDSFAVIRSHTRGHSAIQSRAYREVEHLGALLSTGEEAIPAGPLREIYRKAADETRLRGLADAMTELDEAWQAMKRTHWGITLKIIGRVPGTGGTAGADYLKESAARPLFPKLHTRSGRV